MRKSFQTEWHGIPFESFTMVSSSKIADGAFYSSFYKSFFQKYRRIGDIDPLWLKLKISTKDFLKQHRKFQKNSRILSIGCGLGIMEKALIEEGYTNIEITEVSQEPLRWVLPYVSKDKIHVGHFPDCMPPDKFYDFVYLSSVEYAFDQAELINLLTSVKKRLSTNGLCLMTSSSFEAAGPLKRILIVSKDIAKSAMDAFRLKSRGQFWGYLRNRRDFYHAMTTAGFKDIRDGFWETNTHWDTYWIEART